MYFEIDDLKIGDDSKYHVQSPIVGLDMPTIRMGSGEYSGKDGGYVSTQFYSYRTIVINGFYIGSTCDEADSLRSNLISSLPIRQSLSMFITSFSGDKYLAEVYLRDFKMDMIGGVHGVFQLTFVSPSPYLYDAGDGIDPESGWTEQTIYKLIGGGYVTPYSLPVQWAPGTQPNVIENTGDTYLNPQIILTGVFTNPRITNITENKFIQVDLTTAPGDVLNIDLQNRTITLNGGSVLASRNADSSWWGLRPGNNTIELTSDDSDDDTSAILRWRSQFLGV